MIHFDQSGLIHLCGYDVSIAGQNFGCKCTNTMILYL
ncbi:hypothetical protein AD47_5010, partial [Escherichia coli 6-319-05_S4_C3]